MTEHFLSLPALESSTQVLDISDDPKERALFPLGDDVCVRRIVRRPEVWPDLVSLDVSGRPLGLDTEKPQGSAADIAIRLRLYLFISFRASFR